jgi:hypothetical protein
MSKKSFVKFFAIASLFGFAACATTTKYGAAGDILEFVTGLQNNDVNMINRHIDRQALKNQAIYIARDVAVKAASEKLGKGMGAQIAAIAAADLAKPVIEALADEALSAENLSFFARRAGLNQNIEMPSRFVAQLALQKISDTKVCIPDTKTNRCALYFGQYPDGWKLYAFDDSVLIERLQSKIAKSFK